MLLILLKELLGCVILHGLNPIIVVLKFVSQFLEGMYGAMQQLMMRKHKLMLQNNEIILKKYLEMKVIEQSHALETNFQDTFLYEASKVLCVKGNRLIKKSYIIASLVFYKVLDDQSIFFLIYTILNQKLFIKIRMICVRVMFPEVT